MSTRRLEEILEECVSAYLDGRRSIEESLSLYPSYADELGPLLRTAAGVNYTLGSYSPPAHVQQRGLNRFLSDARSRRSLKGIALASEPRGLLGFVQRTRFAFAGAGVAALVALVAVVGATSLNGGAANSTVSQQSPTRSTPAAVTQLKTAVSNVQDKLKTGQRVNQEDVDNIRQATTDLKSIPAEELETANADVAEQLSQADQTLVVVGVTQPELAPGAHDAQAEVREVAAAIKVPIRSNGGIVPTPTQAGTPTAQPTNEPTATPAEPTPTEAPTPTVAPTDTPEPVTATPSPIDTTDPRGID